jgi:hypothetical protein
MQIRPIIYPGAIILGFFVCMISSCGSETPNPMVPEEEMNQDTVIFMSREWMGALDSNNIDEASGLASSISYPNSFWTHNDSGDGAYLYLINEQGKTQATVKVKNAENRDWEDIAVAYHPVLKKNYIYIADIGDNNAAYASGTIYVLEEPVIASGGIIEVNVERAVTFTYEDGKRDAETLMVDPLTSDIYIVSKRESQVGLYLLSYIFTGTGTIMAVKQGVLPFTQMVGGDISAQGDQIVLKNYTTVYYWKRKPGQSITEALASKPFLTPYIQEPQGEAIAWSRDGNAFYTLSEKGPFNIKPTLYRYKKRP